MCGRGLALAAQGRFDEGIGELQNATGMLKAGGAKSPCAYYSTYLAEAYLLAGRIEEGLATTTAGLAHCEGSLARVHEPELLRLEGELHRRTGDIVAANDALARALALARERGAAGWERRIRASLDATP
jgi:tetratricopeptide (TPR) repeat protein